MGFTIIDNAIFEDESLSIQEQSIMIAIIRYYNADKGYSFPNYDQIKKTSKIADTRTLNKNVNNLIDKGYLKKETKKGIGCKYYPLKCMITPSEKLHQVENSTTCKNTPPPSGELHHDPVENYTTTNTNTNTNTNTTYGDRYLEIFNHWNKEHREKGIAKASKMVVDIKKGVDNALKLKKEDDIRMTIEDIKKSISNYAEVYNLGLFTYQWRLVDFLKRKQKDTNTPQLLLFLDNGTTYVNCKARLNKNAPNSNFIDKKNKEAYENIKHAQGGIVFDD